MQRYVYLTKKKAVMKKHKNNNNNQKKKKKNQGERVKCKIDSAAFPYFSVSEVIFYARLGKNFPLPSHFWFLS